MPAATAGRTRNYCHIDRALTELSEAMPQEKTATLATTAGSREVSLVGLDVMGVEAVEYPVGEYPPAYIGFGTWGWRSSCTWRRRQRVRT